jgi:hypothetical protein
MEVQIQFDTPQQLAERSNKAFTANYEATNAPVVIIISYWFNKPKGMTDIYHSQAPNIMALNLAVLSGLYSAGLDSDLIWKIQASKYYNQPDMDVERAIINIEKEKFNG